MFLKSSFMARVSHTHPDYRCDIVQAASQQRLHLSMANAEESLHTRNAFVFVSHKTTTITPKNNPASRFCLKILQFLFCDGHVFAEISDWFIQIKLCIIIQNILKNI